MAHSSGYATTAGDADRLLALEVALQLAADMRSKQRTYFKVRSHPALIDARTLEAKLDRLLQALGIGGQA